MDGPAGPQQLTVNIPEFKSDASNSYLSTLVSQAKIDDGRTLPVIDSASLDHAEAPRQRLAAAV